MSAINIGNTINKESYSGMVEGIIKVLKASEEYHVDEGTTRKALEILSHIAEVSGVSISGSTFTGQFPDKGDCGDPDDTLEEED